MVFKDFIVYTALILYVLFLAKEYNILGLQKGNKKAKKDLLLAKKKQKQLDKLKRRLKMYTRISSLIGLDITPQEKSDLTYLLRRKGKMLEGLGRVMTPEELHGKLKLIKYVSILVAVTLYCLTFNPIMLSPLVGMFTPYLYKGYLYLKIHDDNNDLERDFPDLYNLMYPKLIQGTSVRLAPVLTDFLNTIEATKGSPGVTNKDVIEQFVIDLRNNINIYADDSLAVSKLRQKYNSVMVINFCNIATQSLKGVDNRDKLLSFKIELTNQQKERMSERAKKLVARGQIAIYVCYAILFEFIILALYAKLNQADGLLTIFGK